MKKFWEIEVAGTMVTVCYGRIGNASQTQVKTFDDSAKAQQHAEKLIASKAKKGYLEAVIR